jgi:hypothetical protein
MEEPHDLICGRCGTVLLRERTVVAPFDVRSTGHVVVDDVSHWCDPEVEVPHLLVVLPTAQVEALEASVR